MSDANAPLSGDSLIERLPFAQFLALRIERLDADCVRLRMPYRPELIGNTTLPALHGGAVASIIEIAAQLIVMHRLGLRAPPETIDSRVDYLRAGRPIETVAEAEFIRLGRRVANLRVTAWQDNAAKPIASGNAAFLLRPG